MGGGGGCGNKRGIKENEREKNGKEFPVNDGRKGLVLATWHAHKYRMYATIMAAAEFTGSSKQVRFSLNLQE